MFSIMEIAILNLNHESKEKAVDKMFEDLDKHFGNNKWQSNKGIVCFDIKNSASYQFINCGDVDTFDLTWFGFVLDFFDKGFNDRGDIIISNIIVDCSLEDALKSKGKDITKLGNSVCKIESFQTLKTLYGFFLDCKNK